MPLIGYSKEGISHSNSLILTGRQPKFRLHWYMKNLKPIVTSHWLPITGMIVMIILVAISYSNISGHQFLNWDDIDYIRKNNRIKSFTIDNTIWMFSDFSMANWHPLTWLSYTFNYVIWKTDPIPYKVTNIILHTINCILVYALTLKILTHVKNNFNSPNTSKFYLLTYKELQYASIFAAIIFGIHPLHVESVTWISERKDVLYSLFFLVTLLFYIKHKETDKDRKWLIASIFMFLFSLMSKPMSVTTPLILILIDIYPLNVLRNNFSIKKAVKILIPNKTTYLILSFLVTLITLLTQSAGIQGSEKLALDSRLINACMSILQYIYHFFWPVNLSTFYSFHPWSTDPNIYSLVPIFVVFAITGWFIFLATKRKIYFPLVGWLYFIITLLPVLGIVKVGAQAAADRYTYMPLLSLFIVASAYVAIFFHSILVKKIQLIAGIMVIASLTFTLTNLTYRQQDHWKNSDSIWEKAISYSPGTAAIPYSNRGSNYYRRGEFRAAVLEFSKALAILPGDIINMEKLGKTYELMKEDTLAIDTYKSIITSHPEHPVGYIRLGDLFYRMQRVEEAKHLYNKAFQLFPTLPATLQRSALVDYFDNNYESAEEKINYLLKIRPNHTGSLQLLAKIKMNTAQYDEAKIIAQQLLAKNPDDSLAIELLAQIESIEN